MSKKESSIKVISPYQFAQKCKNGLKAYNNMQSTAFDTWIEIGNLYLEIHEFALPFAKKHNLVFKTDVINKSKKLGKKSYDFNVGTDYSHYMKLQRIAKFPDTAKLAFDKYGCTSYLALYSHIDAKGNMVEEKKKKSSKKGTDGKIKSSKDANSFESILKLVKSSKCKLEQLKKLRFEISNLITKLESETSNVV